MLRACFTTLSIDFGVFFSLLHGEIAKKKNTEKLDVFEKTRNHVDPPVFLAIVPIETLPLTR